MSLCQGEYSGEHLAYRYGISSGCSFVDKNGWAFQWLYQSHYRPILI